MLGEIILGIWSVLGLLWWVVAWRLVAMSNRSERASTRRRTAFHPSDFLSSASEEGVIAGKSKVTAKALAFTSATTLGSTTGAKPPFLEEIAVEVEELPAPPMISIFKPLPLLGAKGLRDEAVGLESFISQLDEGSELLLGIHEADREVTAGFVGQMRDKYPEASIEAIYRSKPDDVANPKIAWQRFLAQQARGELWLWSDADIVAPPGFLQSARQEYERSGAAMVTFPYIVREIRSAQELPDALFVNAEFYPGVLFLQGLGPVDFGLGSAMLFARADFEQRANWAELGCSLADDFVLGRQFKPVRVGRTTFVTSVDAAGWREAIVHNLRWNKTIFWNHPGGFAARVFILPVMGWLVYLALHPVQPLAWMCLLGMIQLEVFFASAICRQVGCRIGVWNLLTMEAWSLWRICVWFACWLPWPVNWRGELWWGARKSQESVCPPQPQAESAPL